MSTQRHITCQRLAVHGLAVGLTCGVERVAAEIGRQLGEFETSDWPEGFVPVRGSVRRFDEQDVLNHVSSAARAVGGACGGMDVYQEGERFWAVDERWGMAQIDLLKGVWRSWVMPSPCVDAHRCVELAVLWPMAQVLRFKGLHLIPAAAVARDGWAALIVAPFGLEPELTALIRAGYRVIGQRWTALRVEDGRVSLLRMPGGAEWAAPPRLRRGDGHKQGGERENGRLEWIDLAGRYPGSARHHAFCNAVVIASPGRRTQAGISPIAPADATHALRRAWPIAELHPAGKRGQMAIRLAQLCRCAQVQLSRRGADVIGLMDDLRRGASGGEAAAGGDRVSVALGPIGRWRPIPARFAFGDA